MCKGDYREKLKFLKGLRKTTKRKLEPRAADSDVHRVINDALDPHMLAKVEENAVEVWIHPADEKWIKTVQFPQYLPKTLEPVK